MVVKVKKPFKKRKMSVEAVERDPNIEVVDSWAKMGKRIDALPAPKKARRKTLKDEIVTLGPLSDAIKAAAKARRRMPVDEVKDDDDYSGEQVFSPDSDTPLDISGVFLVFDNQDTVEVYDIPASEFDGVPGHRKLAILEKAHGSYINTDNEVHESMTLYNMLQPEANRYDRTGKKLKGDGMFFKYRHDQTRKFMLIVGTHRYFFAGFAQ